MDITLLRIIVTVLSFIMFISIWAWAYSKRNHDRLEQYGSLPLEDDNALECNLSLRDQP